MLSCLLDILGFSGTILDLLGISRIFLGLTERNFWESGTLRLSIIFTKVLVPRVMELPAGEMKEVFCGNYTTFVVTSGFNHFFFPV